MTNGRPSSSGALPSRHPAAQTSPLDIRPAECGPRAGPACDGTQRPVAYSAYTAARHPQRTCWPSLRRSSGRSRTQNADHHPRKAQNAARWRRPPSRNHIDRPSSHSCRSRERPPGRPRNPKCAGGVSVAIGIWQAGTSSCEGPTLLLLRIGLGPPTRSDVVTVATIALDRSTRHTESASPNCSRRTWCSSVD